MTFRFALLAGLALAVTGCTSVAPSAPTTPLESRWIGHTAGEFFAAYGPPINDVAGSNGLTLYSWRGGFINRRACQVELGVSEDYRIRKIRTVVDRKDPKGGPSHCERVLDAAPKA
ncbi:hypothetical protein [Mycoplana sp. MJR14]|uniref:hypothetical protein n=1 Tax=Mycoplana sp. MJR14 TaxID=3032583 RepID=UPI000DDBD8C0|nr:hypothetical protein [Mycoplana sp. MJR14]MDF1632161.1 hypothetical protein [Mycoplana sp. MJR14]